ncbi:glycoside hydrolase family 16 protein [Roseateles oligotrophus]|uniref:Glycoside hydrolase family 16 protein n=1 Tax=Roseateles oligotrophus TaxID=1769250 RepID=A0ABT2Y8J9_9BURK|nr:glycoside hydrolase family 16 protein [Roseateles oligotrophus]MCV2366626.1 glycoside hydrolase family 16 protein [Roseateles oligotrophus]
MNRQENSPASWAQRHLLQALLGGALLSCNVGSFASVTSPVIGKLLWSEEFNAASLDTSVWTATNGNGCQINLCGYGNQELQFYSPNNLSIANVPFEPGTRALAITALRQNIGGNAFSSGKLDTSGKVQVQYGMIEVRMATPQVGIGLWPAAWLLGVSPQVWPRNGEIDMMEMGGKLPAGLPSISPDQFVGSNVITFQQAACVPGNESCAGSTSWQTRNWYTPSRSLANRFVTYRLYWTESQMRFSVLDNGREYDMYKSPLAVNSPSLQAPFYMLLNMAVGGNFTPAATAAQVTAPLPGTMYVDYVRIYELDGKGEVKLGLQSQPEVGKFGVFTDLTLVNNKQVPGVSSDIFVWNNLAAGDIPPFEGGGVLAWRYVTPGQWFGGSVQSKQLHDMTGFRNGQIKLKIKIPANVAFKVGIQDNFTNQNAVTFPANTSAYGLLRDGEWGTATIPVAEIAGPKVALQAMLDMFQIYSVDGALPTTSFQMAIDDIIWDSGSTSLKTTQVALKKLLPAGLASTASAQTSPSSLEFSVSSAGWADVHYTVNGGETQSVRLRQDGTGSRYAAGGLKKGDVVEFRFTYWDNMRQLAVDSPSRSFTMR